MYTYARGTQALISFEKKFLLTHSFSHSLYIKLKFPVFTLVLVTLSISRQTVVCTIKCQEQQQQAVLSFNTSSESLSGEEFSEESEKKKENKVKKRRWKEEKNKKIFKVLIVVVS